MKWKRKKRRAPPPLIPNEYVPDTHMSITPSVTSIEPPSFSTKEANLFEAVGLGDINGAMGLLETLQDEEKETLSQKYNDEGDSILHVAVRRQDEEMFKILLHFITTKHLIYDILLLAISESNTEMINEILKHMDEGIKANLKKGTPESMADIPRWRNSQFDVHMTPIMLAAITGNYKVITIFGSEYASPLFNPKQPDETAKNKKGCCKGCLDSFCEYDDPEVTPTEDVIADAYRRLHLYQAQTSPAMLCFLANTHPQFDPLLRCFDYITKLEKIKMHEVEFSEQYEGMIAKLQKFAIDLVSKCESSAELEMLLSRREGYHGAHDKFPRVIMAIELGFRGFVAHPHTQGTLYTQWAGNDWFDWRYLSRAEKIREFILRLLLLPMYLLFVWGEQGNTYGRLLSSPISRCIYSCVSHITFVCLSLTEQFLELNEPRYRGPRNKVLEIIIMVFVAGQIRATSRQLSMAPKIFFRQAWNWYDCVNHLMHVICFTCWGMLYFQDNESSIFLKQRQPAERENWPYSDTFMIADSFLAIATMMSCGRLLRYVQLSSTIGPIQVALGKMIKNVANFIPIFVIVFSSFCLAITSLYAPYSVIAERESYIDEAHVLSSHSSTLYQMYWGLFGLTDASNADVVSWIKTNSTSQAIPYHYEITEFTGKFLFSVYTFFGATILFSSLLVAYISNTFGKIIEENDINWKFSRAELWIYFSRATVMPPPLNLLPTLWDVIQFIRVLYHKEKVVQDKRQITEQDYRDFIRVLTRRYFRFQTALEDNALASAEEAVTLSEDMEELQVLLRNALAKLDGQNSRRSSVGQRKSTVTTMGAGIINNVSSGRSNPQIQAGDATTITRSSHRSLLTTETEAGRQTRASSYNPEVKNSGGNLEDLARNSAPAIIVSHPGNRQSASNASAGNRDSGEGTIIIRASQDSSRNKIRDGKSPVMNQRPSQFLNVPKITPPAVRSLGSLADGSRRPAEGYVAGQVRSFGAGIQDASGLLAVSTTFPNNTAHAKSSSPGSSVPPRLTVGSQQESPKADSSDNRTTPAQSSTPPWSRNSTGALRGNNSERKSYNNIRNSPVMSSPNVRASPDIPPLYHTLVPSNQSPVLSSSNRDSGIAAPPPRLPSLDRTSSQHRSSAQLPLPSKRTSAPLVPKQPVTTSGSLPQPAAASTTPTTSATCVRRPPSVPKMTFQGSKNSSDEKADGNK